MNLTAPPQVLDAVERWGRLPLSRVLPPLYELRFRSRVFRWYGQLRSLEAAVGQRAAADLQDEKGRMLEQRFPDQVRFSRCDVTADDNLAKTMYKLGFRTLDEVCKPGAILASNTSYLNLDKIATFTQRPQDVIGLHFFSPANVMKLLEVVRGQASAADALATGLAVGRTLQKLPVLTGNAFGFIGFASAFVGGLWLVRAIWRSSKGRDVPDRD